MMNFFSRYSRPIKKSAFLLSSFGFLGLPTCALAVDHPGVQDKPKASSTAGEGGGELVDMILASIDGEPLTMTDLKKYISTHGETAPKDLLNGSPEVRKYLRDMVIDELLSREAKTSGINVSDDEIQAYIDEIKRQNRVDEQGFLALLSTKGMSLDDYKIQVRSDILRTRILSSRVRSKINVLDEDVEKFIKEHPARLPDAGEVHLEQIVLKTEGLTDEQIEDLKSKAEKERKEIVGGEKMSSVDEENYSDLGFMKPSDLRSELSSVVAKLSAGEVTPVIETESGLYLVRMKEAGNDTQSVDEDVKQSIRRELLEQRFKEAMDKFLNDELPKKYHVELKL
ncbi:MAG: SurA N-terminal domain-containing protein [Bdellovibrionota bacterium]